MSCWIASSSHRQVGFPRLPATPENKQQPHGSEELCHSQGRLKEREHPLPRLLHIPATFSSPSSTPQPRVPPLRTPGAPSHRQAQTTPCPPCPDYSGLTQQHAAFATRCPTSYHPFPWGPITVTQASPPDLPALSPPLNSASIFGLSSTCHTREPQPFHTRQFTVSRLVKLSSFLK